MSMYLQKVMRRTNIFLSLEGHWRKEQDTDPDPYQDVTYPEHCWKGNFFCNSQYCRSGFASFWEAGADLHQIAKLWRLTLGAGAMEAHNWALQAHPDVKARLGAVEGSRPVPFILVAPYLSTSCLSSLLYASCLLASFPAVFLLTACLGFPALNPFFLF